MHIKRNYHVLYFIIYIWKKNEIENLRRYVEDEKNENKVLQSFINDFKILKKNI